MIAHTGDFNACLEAIRVIDEQIQKITEICLIKNAFLIITSDHGNVERLFNPLTGEEETQHNPSPVPIYLIAKEFKNSVAKSETEIQPSRKPAIGILSDVAPTVLELMNIPKPKEMTGQGLLKFLISNL